MLQYHHSRKRLVRKCGLVRKCVGRNGLDCLTCAGNRSVVKHPWKRGRTPDTCLAKLLNCTRVWRPRSRSPCHEAEVARHLQGLHTHVLMAMFSVKEVSFMRSYLIAEKVAPALGDILSIPFSLPTDSSSFSMLLHLFSQYHLSHYQSSKYSGLSVWAAPRQMCHSNSAPTAAQGSLRGEGSKCPCRPS